MNENPILFNADMVRAVLDGRKTQTRRVVKLPDWTHGRDVHTENGVLQCFHPEVESEAWIPCPFASIQINWPAKRPYYQTGMRLWVRETWTPVCDFDPSPETGALYRADYVGQEDAVEWTWRPSIHMPRWASRITLEITDIRVERLQSISEADAIAEGCQERIEREGPPDTSSGDNVTVYSPGCVFRELWNSIYGTWEENPWVWVVSFKRLEQA